MLRDSAFPEAHTTESCDVPPERRKVTFSALGQVHVCTLFCCLNNSPLTRRLAPFKFSGSSIESKGCLKCSVSMLLIQHLKHLFWFLSSGFSLPLLSSPILLFPPPTVPPFSLKLPREGSSWLSLGFLFSLEESTLHGREGRKDTLQGHGNGERRMNSRGKVIGDSKWQNEDLDLSLAPRFFFIYYANSILK